MSGLIEKIFMLWAGAEILNGIFRRVTSRGAERHDRGTMALMLGAIGVAVWLAFKLRALGLAPIPISAETRLAVALVVLVFGIVVRWWAILALGRHFTMKVAIREDHEIVRVGPYRRLRHPSYTGALVGFLGMGIALGDGLALAAIVLPVVVATLIRIQVEERALAEAFGPRYEAYAAETDRLVPWVY